VKAFVLFFGVLYLVRVRSEGDDKMWWIPSKKGLFDVKSFYSVLGCLDGIHALKKVFGELRFHSGWPFLIGW